MKATKYLDDETLMHKGVKALFRSLGPIEMRRFIQLANKPQRDDSLIWHKKWQSKLKKDDFFKRVFPGN